MVCPFLQTPKRRPEYPDKTQVCGPFGHALAVKLSKSWINSPALPCGASIRGAERRHLRGGLQSKGDTYERLERFGERAETEIRRISQIVSSERPAHVTFTIDFEDGTA